MPNHASARKRVRQTEKRTQRNKNMRTSVRTLVKRVRAALTEGHAEHAETALAAAARRIDMAVSRGVLHRKTGSRYISRLAHQVHETGK